MNDNQADVKFGKMVINSPFSIYKSLNSANRNNSFKYSASNWLFIFFPFHKNIFMQHFSRAVEVIVIGQWLASNKKNWLCSDRE